jgi:hypothetical protein
MKTKRIPLFLILIISILMTFSIAAAQTEPLTPIEKASNSDLIDAINEGDKGGEIGLAYIGYATTLGTYKKCSTDAFFYTIAVNQSVNSVEITLPRRVRINNQPYFVDGTAYTCKTLPENSIAIDSYAAADQGEACSLQNNRLTVPARSAISIRGKAINFSHNLTRGNAIESDSQYLDIKFDILINNTKKQGIGSLESKGSICDGINFLEVTPYNYVDGGYYVDSTGSKRCSMNYFFVIENADMQYSTVVELPRWVDLDGSRFDIGCKYLYPGCKISGFRHYAWGMLEEGGTFTDPKYHFCDQDRSYGDLCFEEKSLWWIRVPANSKIAIRGMVNNLCNVPEENPLANSMVEIGFDVSDAGSNKWWLDGVVVGTVQKDVDQKGGNDVTEPSQLADRDADEPVNRYLFEDPNLIEVLTAPAEPIEISENSIP